MKKHLLLTIIISIQFISNSLFAQFSPADSNTLLYVFNDALYIDYISFPGNWYWNHEITSIADFHKQIDSSYVFQNNELLNSYQDILLNTDVEYDTFTNSEINNFNIQFATDLFKMPNPFVKLNFSIYSKKGIASAALDSCTASTNNSTAFYIVTGTGANQLSYLAVDDSNYHNKNCIIKDNLKQFGDVYVGGKANEDNRAIYFNKKKLNHYSYDTIYPTYLQSYLQLQNKSIGVNKLIEIIAFIKYLKSKYNKVYVLGLSSGGTEALWASLLSNPTGTMISSGYSILNDTDSFSLALNSYFYYNYMQYFNKNKIHNYISSSNTKYLFTQAQNDNALTQLDLDNNYTKNYFSNLNNVYFYSNYYNHSFPPCQVIDTFFNYTVLANNNNISSAENKIIFQNPVSDLLKIKITQDALIPCEIQLYGSSGEVLFQQSAKTSNIEIDMRNLPDGNYFLRLYNSQQNYSAKILKN